jgi:hypothetical protein
MHFVIKCLGQLGSYLEKKKLNTYFTEYWNKSQMQQIFECKKNNTTELLQEKMSQFFYVCVQGNSGGCSL